MEIVFHIGAHVTDEGLLLRSLLKNSDLLLAHEIAVPGPSRYRKVIGQLVNTLRGDVPAPDVRETLLDAVLDVDEPERLVLSSDSFICVSERVLDDGRLYSRTHKTEWLRNLFPEIPAVFAVALRNPATFIPALLQTERMAGVDSRSLIDSIDPMALRWSEFIVRLREVNPDCPVLVWCNEDTPLIWHRIMHALTGIGPEIRLAGENDMLGRIMRRPGMRALRRHIAEHPDEPADARRDLVLQLLEDHAAEDQMMVEIDIPGWTVEMVEEMTAAYDADFEAIRQMPGVVAIEP